MPPAAAPARVRREHLELLRRLATQGADRTPVAVTSSSVGKELGVSQQAADRYLVELAERGFVERTLAARRQRIRLTPAAMELLRKEYLAYRRLFEGPARLRFHGEVASGLGEGRYYLSQPGYVLQFTERLGYSPFPGTLNVRVAGEALRTAGTLGQLTGIRIDGFQTSGRTFGGATCFVASLNGHSCHLVMPDRTHHADVVEFIAPVSLREQLKVKDGDRVEVEIREA